MAFAFSKSTGYDSGSATWPAWLAAHVGTALTGPKFPLQSVLDPFGPGVDHRNAAIVAYNFKPAAGPKESAAWNVSFLANPADPAVPLVVDYATAQRHFQTTEKSAALSGAVPAGGTGFVVIPLGAVAAWGGSGSGVTVIRQAAREYVSGGKNTAAMSDNNVGIMVLSLLQNLAFASGQALVVEHTTLYFKLMACVLGQAISLFDACPDFQRVVKALVDVPTPPDILQKVLAHVLLPEDLWTPNKKAKLQALFTVLKRSRVHGDLFTALKPGPSGVFILAPRLRGVAQCYRDRERDATKLREAINAQVLAYNHTMNGFFVKLVEASTGIKYVGGGCVPRGVLCVCAYEEVSSIIHCHCPL